MTENSEDQPKLGSGIDAILSNQLRKAVEHDPNNIGKSRDTGQQSPKSNIDAIVERQFEKTVEHDPSNVIKDRSVSSKPNTGMTPGIEAILKNQSGKTPKDKI